VLDGSRPSLSMSWIIEPVSWVIIRSDIIIGARIHESRACVPSRGDALALLRRCNNRKPRTDAAICVNALLTALCRDTPVELHVTRHRIPRALVREEPAFAGFRIRSGAVEGHVSATSSRHIQRRYSSDAIIPSLCLCLSVSLFLCLDINRYRLDV